MFILCPLRKQKGTPFNMSSYASVMKQEDIVKAAALSMQRPSEGAGKTAGSAGTFAYHDWKFHFQETAVVNGIGVHKIILLPPPTRKPETSAYAYGY